MDSIRHKVVTIFAKDFVEYGRPLCPCTWHAEAKNDQIRQVRTKEVQKMVEPLLVESGGRVLSSHNKGREGFFWVETDNDHVIGKIAKMTKIEKILSPQVN